MASADALTDEVLLPATEHLDLYRPLQATARFLSSSAIIIDSVWYSRIFIAQIIRPQLKFISVFDRLHPTPDQLAQFPPPGSCQRN